MEDKELKDLWAKLGNKSAFARKLSDKLDAEGLKRSKHTIYRHWFSNSEMGGSMPKDPKIRKIVEDQLLKEV